MDGGAEWIDVKDPARGSLGAASAQQIAEVVDAVGSQRPISAALGELVKDHLGSTVELPPLEGVSLVKAGMSHCAQTPNWKDLFRQLAHSLPSSVPIVGVYYADAVDAGSPRFEELVSVASSVGSPALAVDTFNKSGGSLLDHISGGQIRSWFQLTRQYGMLCVAAGGLRLEHLPEICSLGPDIVAIRGAACQQNDRRSAVSASCVQELRQALEKETARIC